MNQLLYNHQFFAATVIVFHIISTLAIVDAFSYSGSGGISTICKNTHDVHKLLHHCRLFATTKRDDNESTKQSKSIFDQFKMPWDNNDSNNDDDGDVSKSQQWWPIKSDDQQQSEQSPSSTEQQTKQPRQRKPRVPRYPSALQYDDSSTTIPTSTQSSSSNVDDAETTKDTLRDDTNDQQPSLKDDQDIEDEKDRELSLSDTTDENTIDSNSSNKRIPAHHKLHKMESQLTKYKNRYILLEDALKSKVKELSIMRNRVTLLEDVLSKLQKSGDDEKSGVGIQVGSSTMVSDDNDSLKDSKEIANLTATIEIVNQEKAQLVSHIESMTLQQTEMEEEYKAMVANLKAQLTSLEQERDNLLDDIENRKEGEQQNTTASKREAEDDTIQQQQIKISELTSQLTHLLDAHTELEQLQNDTETSLQQMKEQLKVKHAEHEIALTNERQEKETYMKKWQDILGDLEEDAARMLVDQYNIIKPQQLLDENEKKYEAMLEQERSRVDEWRGKYETLSNDTSASMASNTEEEWISLQKQLEEVTELNINATAKVNELEIQLEEAQQNNTSSAQDVEQQQKLQEYLQAQLKTYYDTIEEQKNAISQYDEKLSNLEAKHEESMLIATNSVEASQQREESLLTNIEELESELSIAKDITDTKDEEMNTLQSRLDEMKDERESLITHDRNANKELAKHNKELAMKVERLEYRVEEVSLDRDRLQLEKRKMQMDSLIHMKDEDDGVSSSGRDQAKQKSRRWYKPWTFLRRRR